MREVAAEAILSRFGALASAEIFEKSPGEIVTIADRHAEQLLVAGLRDIDSSGRPIGEEACSADPNLLGGIGEGRLWLIDPIDGTANFAAGSGPFGIMLALIEEGLTMASWIFDPLSGRLCHAVAGQGAYIDDERVSVHAPRRDIPIAALATQFMAPATRDSFRAEAGKFMSLVPIPRCAAEHYPRICSGVNDIALFQRTLPWDHAAGVLFLIEAGGAVCRWNGDTYRVDDGGVGLLAANSAANLSLIKGLTTRMMKNPEFEGILRGEPETPPHATEQRQCCPRC